MRGRFLHHFLDLLLDEPFRQHAQLLRIAAVPASLKLIFFFDFDVDEIAYRSLLERWNRDRAGGSLDAALAALRSAGATGIVGPA